MFYDVFSEITTKKDRIEIDKKVSPRQTTIKCRENAKYPNLLIFFLAFTENCFSLLTNLKLIDMISIVAPQLNRKVDLVPIVKIFCLLKLFYAHKHTLT